MANQRASIDPPPMYFDMDAEAEELPKEGPTFKMGGEEFHCLPMVPGAALNRVMSGVKTDASGRNVISLPDVTLFIEECLIDERIIEVPPEKPAKAGDDWVPGEPTVVTEDADDVTRWQKLLEDKKRSPTAKQLYALQGHLIAAYTERPTQASRV